MSKKIYPNHRRNLQAKDQMDCIVRHGPGLWHFDSGVHRFYYSTATPADLENYIGYTHQSCAVLGTQPVKMESVELSLL